MFWLNVLLSAFAFVIAVLGFTAALLVLRNNH